MKKSFRRQAYNIFFRISPLIILVLLELSLRFLGVGQSYEVFKISQDKEFCELNPAYYRRYVTEKQFREVAVLDQRFEADKPDSTRRIFLIGDQSMCSLFPESNSRQIIPDFYDNDGFRYQIVQLAIPYTNSFSMACLIGCLKDYDADACIVLSGSNEYYGIPRKSSWMQDIDNFWGVTAYVNLKKYRFLQVLDHFVYLRKEANTVFPPEDIDEWAVPYRSAEYEEVVSYFDRNLRRMIKRAEFPLFFVTLPEHLKARPYRSLFDDKDLSDAEFAREFAVLLHNADRFSIERWINDLKAWEPETAIYYYCLAMMAENAGDTEEALKNYERALELDVFRVRMDPKMNELIIDHSETSEAFLIDIRENMMQASNGGLRINRYFQSGLALNDSGRTYFIDELKNALLKYFHKSGD